MSKAEICGINEALFKKFPENWVIRSIGDCYDIQQGKALNQKAREGKFPHPFLRTANVFWGRINLTELDQMDFSDKEIEKLKLIPDDIVVCEGGDIGRTAIWDGQIDLCMYQNHLHRLRAKDNENSPRFFMYWMQAAFRVFDLYAGQGNKTTIPNLSKQRLSAFLFPVPPLLEQRAISHVLQTVQQAREARLRELELERERKAALMEHLFTHGTRGEPTKQTEIGEMPESWQVKKLEDLAEIQSGGTPLRSHPEYHNGNIDWVKTLDLNEGIVIKTEEKITDLGFKAIRGKMRPVNTVMVGMYGGSGTVGKSGILGMPATTNQAVCCIEPNPEKFDSFYILYYLIYFRPIWMHYAIGTRKDPNISKGIIESTIIPLPPLDQQREIATTLKICDSVIASLDLEANLLDELFRAMLEELMTGRLPSRKVMEMHPG